MRKDWKYLVYLSAAILFYQAVKLLSPRDIDWSITYHNQDKNPFGAYALDNFIQSLFPKASIHKSNYTLYELYDTLTQPVNFFSISTTFEPGKEDTEALLKNIELGGNAFIAAQYFSGPFADTLSLNTSDYFFETTHGSFNQNDTSFLLFKNESLKPSSKFWYPRKNIHNYFLDSDSTTTIVSENDLHLPVTIKIVRGKGALYLNATPLSFTNVYILGEDNYQFAELSLSHLPMRDTYWTEFYHLGRLEARTPLRFILTNEPLRWGYYLTVTSLLLFILFEAKRRQRIIPIIRPLSNTSLEFVQTVGNLYYQSKDHKNIAEKRIQFLTDQIFFKHGIHIHHLTNESMDNLARKTGNLEADVRSLFDLIQNIQNKNEISEEELKDLTKKIDSFKN